MLKNLIFFVLIFINTGILHAADTYSRDFVGNHSRYCHNCFNKDNPSKLMICKGCGHARYCSRECQAKVWKFHKLWCKRKEQVLIPADLNLSAQYTPAEIKTESFNIFSDTFKSTLGLQATMLAKDSFFDYLSSNNKVVANLFYKSLMTIVGSDKVSLKTNPKILMPGIGFMAPAELSALTAALKPHEIHGFDIDDTALSFCRASNSCLANNLQKADGTTKDIWQHMNTKDFDIVLLMHPLFCDLVQDGKVLNSIGKSMLGNIKNFLAGTQLIIFMKSVAEADAVSNELENIGFENITKINNDNNAFPASSFGESLKRSLGDVIFNRETDIVSELVKTDKRPKNEAKWLKSGEYRYRMIILANHPQSHL